MAGISKALLPENREAYFQKVLLPGFESLGIQVRNMVNER